MRGGRKVLTFANHLEGLIIFMVVLYIHSQELSDLYQL